MNLHKKLYTTETSDEYKDCGTKIWLVLADDVTAEGMVGWRPDAYLFESDLIRCVAQ